MSTSDNRSSFPLCCTKNILFLSNRFFNPKFCHLLTIGAAFLYVASRLYCFFQTGFSPNLPPSENWKSFLSLMLHKECIVSFKPNFLPSNYFGAAFFNVSQRIYYSFQSIFHPQIMSPSDNRRLHKEHIGDD